MKKGWMLFPRWRRNKISPQPPLLEKREGNSSPFGKGRIKEGFSSFGCRSMCFSLAPKRFEPEPALSVAEWVWRPAPTLKSSRTNRNSRSIFTVFKGISIPSLFFPSWLDSGFRRNDKIIFSIRHPDENRDPAVQISKNFSPQGHHINHANRGFLFLSTPTSIAASIL